jgi:predicted nuclease of predicted toxin-antitoxin system
MRFHLDEHVAHAIADGLRRRGIDVTTTADAALLSASDDEHMAFAKRDGRVIVTQDTDFLRNAANDTTHLVLRIILTESDPSVRSFATWS